MPSLSNEFLSLNVKAKGAELSSVFDKKNGVEHLWQADPEVWGRHAPVLFPIVGRLKDDRYIFEGNTYSMKQHGWARDREFEWKESGSNELSFSFRSDEESKKIYPFDFEFRIRYVLAEKQVQVAYEVENTGKRDMPFSLGAHPGFAVPMGEDGAYEDYEICFEQKETLERHLLEGGLYTGERMAVMEDSHILPLTKDMFDHDALVFHHPASSYVILRSRTHRREVRVSMRGFPYLGIWAKPGAPFVCIEPWQGLADHVDTDGYLMHKKGIMTLGPSQVHRCGYEIMISS